MIPKLPVRTRAVVVSALTVRRAVGVVGLLLPVVLLLGGWLIKVPIQDNVSSYYHTPLRDILVGSLAAIAAFLFCYRGHGRIENWTANVGAVASLGVAICPLDPGSDPLDQRSLVGYLHSFLGGVFFLTLAVYSLYHFPRSSSTDTEDEPHQWERNLLYRGSGVVILVSMLAMTSYLFLPLTGWKAVWNQWNLLFWMESVAAWAFAFAWLTKGRAMVADLAVELMAYPREVILPRVLNISSVNEQP